VALNDNRRVSAILRVIEYFAVTQGYYAPPVWKGVVSVACVCLSVCLSVAYIVNNSRTQIWPSAQIWKATLDATRIPVSRSKVRVTRPINADTHSVPYLPNDKAYELQTWYTDGGRRPALATGATTSKVKGHVINLSRVGPMAHKSKTNSRSITKIDRQCDVYVGGRVRVSEFMISLDLQHCGSK